MSSYCCAGSIKSEYSCPASISKRRLFSCSKRAEDEGKLVIVCVLSMRSHATESRPSDILQLEEDELKEFELLEMAAEESLFSSQCSLVEGIMNRSNPLTSNSEIPQPVEKVSQNLPARDGLLVADAHKSVEQMGSSELRNYTQCEELSPAVPNNHARNESTPHNSPQYPAAEDDHDSTDGGLDETLKPSLAAGVVFSDEEAWESFTHGSPVTLKGQKVVSSGTTTPEQATVCIAWTSPVRREQLDKLGRTVFSSPLPASSIHNPLPTNIHPKQQATLSPHLPTTTPPIPPSHGQSSGPTSPSPDQLLHRQYPRDSTIPSLENHSQSKDTAQANLPPPSALVSKLFPALRKEREESRRQVIPPMVAASSRGLSAPTPSSVTTQGDTGPSVPSPMVTMNEELKQKLCQLESEIERFRAENAALERLRREKEEVSIYVCIVTRTSVHHLFLFYVGASSLETRDQGV